MEHVSKESFLKRHRQNSIIQIIWGNSCFALVLKGIQCKLWPKLIFLLSRGLSSSLSLLQPTEVKRRPCTRFFAWGGIVQWCAVPGSVILKHLLTGKGLWEQTWDWQVGFNSRDFVQLPKNPNPDAGAEHMLPDRNDVLGKRRSQQVFVRHWFWVQHCLALSFSQPCLGISKWLGLEVYCIFSLCCTQKVPHQRQIPYLPSASFSLSVSSLHEISSLSSLFPSHTHSERYIFIVTPQEPQSSQDTNLPYFFLYPCSVGGHFLSLKAPAKRQQACINWNKEEHSPRPVIFYPFTATLLRR